MKITKMVIFSLFFFSIGSASFLYSYPYLRTQKILKNITKNQLLVNQWFYVPELKSSERRVETVSPDLSYAYCLFDLEKTSTRVKIAQTDYYQSVAIYGMNTDHFTSVISEGKESMIEFLLVKSGTKKTKKEGEEIIELPFDRGFLLLRRLKEKQRAESLTDVCTKVENV